MKKGFASLALLLTSLLALPASAGVLSGQRGPAPAEPAAAFSAIYVFGGPLEDDGNYASVYGDLPAPFYQNHFTNGPNAIDYLAGYLGFTLSPSLHRVGAVKGNNFASADALAYGPDTKDLQGQIDAFLNSKGGVADPAAFYYVIIGGNDIISATYETDNAKSLQIIDNAIQSKRLAIQRFVDAGVKTLFFDNFTNIGLTPQIRAAGLSQRGEWISRIHNEKLRKMFNEEQAEFGKRLNLIQFDFYQFSANELIASAAPLGFTNTTDACLSSSSCDLNHYVFINDLFLTARVHQIWGGQLTATLIRGLYCNSHPADIYCISESLIEHTPHGGT
jgi:phospholipase/lecithinase/hemolysin